MQLFANQSIAVDLDMVVDFGNHDEVIDCEEHKANTSFELIQFDLCALHRLATTQPKHIPAPNEQSNSTELYHV